MRQRLADAGPRRVAMVVGAFHAPALAAAARLRPARSGPPHSRKSGRAKAELVTSMVPYTFDLLDSRSGYPAGIRDPQWQQAVLDCAADPSEVERAAAAFAVRVTAAMRSAGHPAGPAEAREVARLAGDLARLRGLPAPGRGELVEALQTTLAQGEPAGRGRAVAQAMGGVLVGDRRGRVAAAAPASGLHPAVIRLLADLRLPEPGAAPRTLRLDPLRSALDRRREVALQRLAACRIPYAEADDVVGVGGADAVTTVWQVRWSPTTDAAIGVAGRYGVTLAQAAEGRLRAQRRRQVADGGPTTAQALTGLAEASACGLPRLVRVRLGDVATVGHDGTLPEIVAGIDLVQRLASGHVPGLPDPPGGLGDLIEDLYAAAVLAVDGLAGSTDLGDARALLALVHRADAAGRTLRLHHALRRLTTGATAMMQAAAGAVLVILELADPDEFGTRLASWVDGPPAELTERLGGALAVAAPLLESGGALAALLDRIEELSDADFLHRLPALRGGFAALSPAARDRLLRMVGDRSGDVHAELTASPEALGAWLAADLAGRDAVGRLGLFRAEESARPEESTVEDPATEPERRSVDASHRWRLVLGRQSDALPASMRRFATALDELYGAGHGEGSYAVGGPGGGRGSAFPSVREWSEELEAVFGAGVREEVLARAAETGRLDVALHLDPAAVRPSIELLHAVLSLASGMPEASLARLRPLVARLVAALTAPAGPATAPGPHRADQPAPHPAPHRGARPARHRPGQPAHRPARRRRPHPDPARAPGVPQPRPPQRRLAADRPGRRVRLDGTVDHLVRADRVDPGWRTGVADPLRHVRHGDRRPDRPAGRPARAAAAGQGRRRHAHRQGAAVRARPGDRTDPHDGGRGQRLRGGLPGRAAAVRGTRAGRQRLPAARLRQPGRPGCRPLQRRRRPSSSSRPACRWPR